MYPMPIIFDNIVFSLQKAGGISVVWYELLSRIIRDKSFNCRFIDYGGNNIFRNKLALDENKIFGSNRNGLNSRYLPVKIKSDMPFIFHSSYYRVCSTSSAYNITTVHDFTYEYFRSGLAKRLHSWQKFQAVKHSAAVVCISENTKKDLLKFMPDIDEDKIHVIYNGVSEDYFEIDKGKPVDLPFPSGSYIVFVGSRTGYKNFDFVVKTIAESDLNLVIVGSKLTKEEVEFVERYFSKNRYKCMGFLINQDLNIIYNHAMALAYPSSYEGFGIPVLEAQRAGCPVIALNTSSIPEVIGETPCLMDELSEEEFLSKLNLLRDKDTRNAVVRKGVENSKRFSWDKMYKEYIELYKTLWAQRRGG